MNLTWGNAATTSKGPLTLAGRIGGSLFFAVFLGMGLLFLGLLGREVARSAATYRWPAVPCTIESSVVGRNKGGCCLEVRYRYEINGRTWHSDRVSLQASGNSDYTAAQRLADQYPPGAGAQCRVNPANPAEAILRHDGCWIALFLVVPLIFVAVGGGGIYALWRPDRLGGAGAAGRTAPARSGLGKRGTTLFFGVFLLLGGGLFGGVFVRPLLKVREARQWPATPCVIQSSGVRTHSGNKGSTYSIDILYSYQVDGREYRSNQYEFLGGSSSGYAGKAAVVRRFAAGAAAVCYVNPRDPSEAVLERRFTPGMLFGLIPLVFFFVGAGGLVWTWTGGGSARPAIDPTAAAPWLQRADWAAKRLVYSTRPVMVGAWVFAGLWNLISLPLLFVLAPEAAKPGNHLVAIGLIVPVIGVGLLVWAIRARRCWQAFGDSVFELATLPGAVGGVLEGTLRLGRFLQPEGGFKFKLLCTNRVTTGSGKNRSTSERLIWEDERVVGTSTGDAVSVAFCLPADGSETSGDNPENCVLWRLEVSARVSAGRYAARFEVPVFKVAQTPAQTAEAERVRAQEQAEIAHYQQPPGSRIRVEVSARGGKEFFFPAGRNPGAAVGVTIFLAIWSGAIGLMVHLRAPLLFPIVFGLFDLMLIVMVLQLWFGTTRVVAETDGLTITRGLLGRGRTRTIAAADVAEIKTKIGMTAGTSAYWDIQVVCRSGGVFTAGTMIKEVHEAEWLAAEMASAIGRRP